MLLEPRNSSNLLERGRVRHRAWRFYCCGLCSAVVTSVLLFGVAHPARAGERDDATEMARQQQEQAREQQKEARERQREAAKQAQELQQQEIKQSREIAREQQEQARAETHHEQAPVAQPATPSPQGALGGSSENEHHGDGQGTSRTGSTAKADGVSQRPKQLGEKEKSDKEQRQQPQHEDDHRPPATVEQWLKQLVKPVAAETSPAAKPVLNPAIAKAATGGTPPPIDIPDFSHPEVLAVNATSEVVERAKGLGFKLKEATSLASLDFAVTRLLVPDGMSAADAQALLNKELPQESFGINKKYRIYRTATGAGPEERDAAFLAQPAGKTACGADHCFARDLIDWKPELRGCASGLRIGIIDTSVDVKHPTFAHKRLEVGHLGHEGAPSPDWHGTGVTALLAGDSSSGTPGLVPDANFYIADVFYADTDGQPASDTLGMLRAFDWLEAKDVKIVNMSLSGPSDELVARAISKLASKGVLFVAAAGNDGPAAGPSYPAAYDNVIAVTAVGKDMKGYRYANRGSYIDVAAPGVSIWTALPGSKEGYHSGTSFATPYVTAALAAIYQRLPTKSQSEALKHLAFKDLGEPGLDPIYGRGLLVAPVTCRAGQVAEAPVNRPGSIDFAPVQNPVVGERLPWLGLQDNN